jgi:hypothetical protein
LIWLMRMELLFEVFDFNRTGVLSAPKDLLFMIGVLHRTMANFLTEKEDEVCDLVEKLKREVIGGGEGILIFFLHGSLKTKSEYYISNGEWKTRRNL